MKRNFARLESILKFTRDREGALISEEMSFLRKDKLCKFQWLAKIDRLSLASLARTFN